MPFSTASSKLVGEVAEISDTRAMAIGQCSFSDGPEGAKRPRAPHRSVTGRGGCRYSVGWEVCGGEHTASCGEISGLPILSDLPIVMAGQRGADPQWQARRGGRCA